MSDTTDLGGLACWHNLRDRLERYERFVSGPMWKSIVGLTCRGLRSSKDADDVESFFKKHQPGSAARKLAQALETVRIREARLMRDREEVRAFVASMISN